MKYADFYILTEDEPKIALKCVCRVIDLVYREGKKAYVNCEDENQLRQLDDLLWTFKDISFVPHCIYSQGADIAPPIQLGFAQDPSDMNDVLINLPAMLPEYYQRFAQIIEVVPNDKAARASVRNHYRLLREQGYQVRSHEINQLL